MLALALLIGGVAAAPATCASSRDALCLDCAAVGAPACCDQGCFEPYSGAALAEACRSMCRTVASPPRAAATVKISADVVAETLPEYLSVDLDWWHNTTHDCAPAQGRSCWANAGVLWLPLEHPRIKASGSAFCRCVWCMGCC